MAHSTTEQIRVWPTLIPGVECFEAQLYRHRFSKHFHDAYTIGFNRTGQGQCFHQREIHHHYPGSFNCINPGEVHTGEVASDSENWFFQNIYITPAALRQILEQLDWQSSLMLPCFSQLVVNDRYLQDSFQWLYQSLAGEENAIAEKLEQQSLLLHFCTQLFSRHTQYAPALKTARKELKHIERVRAFIDAHYAESITLDDLSAIANLNPYYLIRCFHQQFGLPPHSYKKQYQLLRAKRALQDNEPIAAIALSHGFYDQSHFTRTFKRAYGLTPGQYQKSHRRHHST